MLRKPEPVGHISDIVNGNTSKQHCVLCVATDISEIKTLDTFLGCKVTHSPLMLNNACAVIINGHGRKARKAMSASTALELPKLYLEQGPLYTHTHKKHKPLSLVLDDRDFHYSAKRQTHLENLIAKELDEDQQQRAQGIIEQWRKARASKYNQRPEPEKMPSGRYVLIVEQAPDDPTLAEGLAESHELQHLQKLAEREYPDCEVVTITDQHHPVALLENARALFTATSYLGFEALLWGVPVYATGMPFYAGWGLTQDFIPAPSRRQPVSLEQLVYAKLVTYSRYVHPETEERCEVEDILQLLPESRREALQKYDHNQGEWQKTPKFIRWLVGKK
ncbi:hypothetical protein [Aliidiomarina minuta]|nr:hypothetical protein [Aliidiomarina minuta]